jgi:cyclopropane fatty-acyl-phospholipid synthase-like methyltransferase
MFNPLKLQIMSKLYKYSGNELLLFEEAKTWKRYFKKKIQPFVHGEVLEVGAGIGGTTKILNDGSARKWTMLEPDENMYRYLLKKTDSFPLNTTIEKGSLADVKQRFDTILYIDVLEHIKDDAAELARASTHLSSKGCLIVLCPAFNFLFNKFDQAIGHIKRYKKKELKKITPPGMKLVSITYLDSAGFFASAANKFFLHQSYPSGSQIRFWDKCLVPISKITDPLFLYLFGKSILTVWEKS